MLFICSQGNEHLDYFCIFIIVNNASETFVYRSYKQVPQVALVVKNPHDNAGDIRDASSTLGCRRSPGGGHGNTLQYSSQENPWTEERGSLAGYSPQGRTELYMTEAAQQTCTFCEHVFISGVGPGFPLVFGQIRTGIIKIFFVPLGYPFPVLWPESGLFSFFVPPVGISWLQVSLALHLGCKESRRDTRGTHPPCHSLCPQVPRLQYIFTPFRIFLYLLIMSGMFQL